MEIKRIDACAAVLAAACFALAAPAAQAEVDFVSKPKSTISPGASPAEDPKAYRVDVARHLYDAYGHRIYKGMLPPLVHAIVVVETVLDEAGGVREINVIRAPSHAPEVTAAVRQMIQQAGPFPAPSRLNEAPRYMETWLVDKSGRFQLDTLSEGQRSR